MVKREALQQFHRQVIAQAADKLFQRDGVDATTMDAIAREAGYSKATLYVYFTNKEEISDLILLGAMGMLLARIEAGLAAGKDVIEQYWGVCEEMVAFAREYPHAYFSLLETIDVDPISREKRPLLEEIYQLGERAIDVAASLVENGIEQGYFRKDVSSQSIGFLFSGLLAGTIGLAENKEEYIQSRMGMDKEEFFRFSFQLLLQALLVKGDEGGK